MTLLISASTAMFLSLLSFYVLDHIINLLWRIPLCGHEKQRGLGEHPGSLLPPHNLGFPETGGGVRTGSSSRSRSPKIKSKRTQSGYRWLYFGQIHLYSAT